MLFRSGGAALFLEKNSTATPQQVYDALTANSTKNKVTSSNSTNNHLLYTLVFGGTTPVNQPPVASFTFNATDLSVTFNASGSSDSDGTISSYAWNFGDGATGSGVTPSHTYASAGIRTVTLTVTDDDGAKGSTSESVTVSTAPVGDIMLSAVGYKDKGRQRVVLTWSGATSVEIFRNGSSIATVNDSPYTDNINNKGGGTYTYKVCNPGTSTCSNTVTVTF